MSDRSHPTRSSTTHTCGTFPALPDSLLSTTVPHSKVTHMSHAPFSSSQGHSLERRSQVLRRSGAASVLIRVRQWDALCTALPQQTICRDPPHVNFGQHTTRERTALQSPLRTTIVFVPCVASRGRTEAEPQMLRGTLGAQVEHALTRSPPPY